MSFFNKFLLCSIILLPFFSIFSVEGKSISEQLQSIQAIPRESGALTNTEKLTQLNNLEKLLQQSDISPKEEIAILAAKSLVMYKLGQLGNAITTAKQERDLAKKHGFKQLEADANRHIGAYASFKGDPILALNSYKLSLSYYETVDEPMRQADLYFNMASIHDNMGLLEDALTYNRKAKAIYQKFGSIKDNIDISYNLANIYISLKRYPIALKLINDIIVQRHDISDNEGIALAYTSLSILYRNTNEYKKAENVLNKAQDYFLNIYSKYDLSYIYINFADLYNMMAKTNKAILYAEKAKKISLSQNNQYIYATSLQQLAIAYFYQAKYHKALELITESMQVATKYKDQEQINANLALQSLIYAALNQPDKAFENHKKFENSHLELINSPLNFKLSKLESEKLQQQVIQLKQQKRLQALELERASQKRNITIISIVVVLLIIFFIIYQKVVRRSTQTLELKVKNRTRELEQLMTELNKANNIKSQFLANISHEIRTPLTTVIGQAEAIVNGDIDDVHITKEVNIIHGNSLHLLELTNNILDLNKIEANKIELEITQHNLHETLKQLVDMFTTQASSKGLTFEINHSLPDPFFIDIDAFRVKQILINLCSNAIKFTSVGHVQLTLILNHEQLLFKISDSGIGMSRSQLASIFENFTQGDSSISRRFGGTGLGLCLSEQLAKIMDGTIEVESELNKGSEFIFTLPCNIDTSVNVSHINKTKNDTINTLKAPLSPDKKLTGTILLADDHQDNRRLITRLLESLGLDVLTARDGNEVIELLENNNPKLVLMDIQMPETDGIEALKILRQQGCDIPIIALTANAMSHEVEHYLSIGFENHLSKPIERSVFIPMITKYYDKSIEIEHLNDRYNKVDMSDLVTQFKSNLVLEREDIILLFNSNNIDELVKLSHRIAGAAQMFGFAHLSAAAIQLEIAAKKENLDNVNIFTQDLLNEIDQVLW